MLRQEERAFVRPERFAALAIVMVVLVVVLSLRLWDLQVVRGAYYRELAEQNRILRLPVPADRGIVTDRNGVVLARNMPGFAAMVLPVDLPVARETELAARLAPLVELEPEEILETIARGRERNPYEPVKVSQRPLARESALLLVERAELFPGVRVEADSIRQYVDGPLYSPLLGYVGPITEAELERRREAGYLAQDVIGRTGLERVYERYLRGVYGLREIERDAAQREIKTLGITAATPGGNVALTIDDRLQRILHAELLKGVEEDRFTQAVGVAMNPQNGEILAMVSIPAYDNNWFVRGITPAEMAELNADDRHPLVNKAIGEIFPPGSTYKMVTGLAALSEGTARRSTVINVSSNVINVGGFNFFDWRAHGSLDFLNGFAYSSDIYFYTLGGGFGGHPGVGPEKMHEYASALGFGAPTGIDLPGEESGINPDPAWKMEVFEEPWTIGNTYHASIGQGFVAVTPLQLLNAYAAVANGGTLYRPHLMQRVVDHEGKLIVEEEPEIIRQLPISSDNLQLIREGARKVVTSRMAYMPNAKLPVAGKTGTAEFGEASGKDSAGRNKLGFHNWFVSYIPKSGPDSTDAEIAMVVFTFDSSRSYCVSCVSPAVVLTQRVYEAYYEVDGEQRAARP
ncbi:MAG: penicillin-binding protein 2 [Candidatus Limnocylindria bacterium]